MPILIIIIYIYIYFMSTSRYAYYAQFGYPGKAQPAHDPEVAARLQALAKLGLELRKFAEREFLWQRTAIETSVKTVWAARFDRTQARAGATGYATGMDSTLIVVNGANAATDVELTVGPTKLTKTVPAWGVDIVSLAR
jgi:hypothetical protein